VLFDAAVDALAGMGAEIIELTIPHHRQLSYATRVSWPCEAFAYHRSTLQTRWEQYGRPTRIALTAGALVSGADYEQAQRARRVGREAVRRTLGGVDALLTPTTVRPAPILGAADFDSITESTLTRPWNAVGFPALSVPMGVNASGFPLGLQIVTRPLSDALALRIGDAYQQVTDWHSAVPPPVA